MEKFRIVNRYNGAIIKNGFKTYKKGIRAMFALDKKKLINFDCCIVQKYVEQDTRADDPDWIIYDEFDKEEM